MREQNCEFAPTGCDSPVEPKHSIGSGLLVGIETYKTEPTFEALRALLTGLQSSPGVLVYFYHHDYVTSGGVQPAWQRAGLGKEDKTLRLWDVATRQPLGEPLRGHTNFVYGVAFSPDGKTLASASEDKTVRLWDLAMLRPSGQPLHGHSYSVYSVAFTPDAKTLASASIDGTVRLWDVATRQPLGEPLQGHTDLVYSVAFSPDGKTLASASEDKAVRLWQVNPSSWMSRTCTIVNRNLSLSESGDKIWEAMSRTGKPVLSYRRRGSTYEMKDGRRATWKNTPPEERCCC